MILFAHTFRECKRMDKRDFQYTQCYCEENVRPDNPMNVKRCQIFSY